MSHSTLRNSTAPEAPSIVPPCPSTLQGCPPLLCYLSWTQTHTNTYRKFPLLFFHFLTCCQTSSLFNFFHVSFPCSFSHTPVISSLDSTGDGPSCILLSHSLCCVLFRFSSSRSIFQMCVGIVGSGYWCWLLFLGTGWSIILLVCRKSCTL